MIPHLNLVGWIACIIYSTVPCFWFLVHPWADRWRKRRRSPYLVLLPAWAVIWIVVGLVTERWQQIVFYSTAWSWIPAVGLFALGFWLYAQSGRNFSVRQLGGIPEVVASHREQTLVTIGIRAYVRHPVYLAHLCELLAWSVGTGLVVCWGLTVFAIITGTIMIRMEEEELAKRFGEQYAAYKKRVPAIVPRRRPA